METPPGLLGIGGAILLLMYDPVGVEVLSNSLIDQLNNSIYNLQFKIYANRFSSRSNLIISGYVSP